MKILKLEIENVGPYQDNHEFVLNDRGLVMVFGDNQDELRMNSNGSGKSWLFDSLDWCLFGKIPRGDHADSVITDKQKYARVSVTLIDDSSREVVIERDRKLKSKSNLSISIDGEVMSKLDIVETQKLVEQVLGMDRGIFHSTVLFSQTDLVHYADSTDKQRIDILTQILGLEEIDTLQDSAKGHLSKLNTNQANVSFQLQSIELELQSINVDDLAYKIDSFNKAKEEDLARLNAMLTGKATERGQIAVLNTTSLRKEINNLRASQLPRVPPNDLKEKVENLQKTLADINISAGTTENARRGQLKEIETLNHRLDNPHELFCPACGQVVTREHMLRELADTQSDLDASVEHIKTLSIRKDTVVDELAKLNELVESSLASVDLENQKIQEKMVLLQSQLSSADIEAGKVKRLDREITDLQVLILNKENEENPWVFQKTQLETKKADLASSRDKLNAQLSSMSQLKSYYDFWVKALGPKGLKSYILDSKLKLLNDYINRWVKLLTGGTIWVQFGSTKKTRANKVVNSPDVRVCRWNLDGTITERNYRSWSGGEKQRISLAIDFGLSLLVSSRAKYSYDIIIMDEVFKHLDSAGKEAVVEMLKALSRDKSSVFVVDHDSEFQNMFDNKVIIRKKNGVSQIIEVGHEQEKDKNGKVLSAGTVRRRHPVRKPVRV